MKTDIVAERTEVEHHEQRAEKHHADFGCDIGECQQDRGADDHLRRHKIMILEALGEPGLGQRHIASHREEAAEGECRTDRRRNRPRLGVDQQDQGVDEVAGSDHSLNLTALPGAERQRPGRPLRAHAFQFSRNWIQKRGRSGAHGLAIDGTHGPKLSGKAFRFGIFQYRISAIQSCNALVSQWELARFE